MVLWVLFSIAIPSGALAAVFHSSTNHSKLPIHPNASSLEHLLVYSPSGHVIQHELLPSAGAEACDSSSRTGSGPTLHFQDEDLHVNAEPIQWWDVCRRSNWPERQENISKFIYDSRRDIEAVMDTSDYEDNDNSASSTNCVAGKEFGKAQERPYWYLSNAEVQINTVRLPIWQKSKVVRSKLKKCHCTRLKLGERIYCLFSSKFTPVHIGVMGAEAFICCS